MKRCFALPLLLVSALMSQAQFYPDSNAVLCYYPGPGFPEILNLVMRAGPDTAIMGHSYQRVHVFWGSDLWTQNWTGGGTGAYVRSTADGKGYVFLPDSMAEYLTGDVGAMTGDTVRNVLADNFTQFEPVNRRLWDFVVDSVVTITNDGITITRHYVHEPNFYNSNWEEFDPRFCFWQAGMGTAQGVHLNMDDNFGHSLVLCAMTGDSTVLSNYTWPPLMPSAFPCCVSAIAGIEEVARTSDSLLSENPTPGVFHFKDQRVFTYQVFDTQGRLLFATRGSEVDLSTYPPGVYTAVVTTPQGRQAVRLAVVR